jgi:putative transposase
VLYFANVQVMPRAKTILQSEFPYNIGARCINKEWFNIPMQTVWDIFCEELKKTSLEHALNIHSFVLMSNHFHLIASTPKANISQCMQQFMYKTSRRLTREGNRINETFAGRHYKCILNHPNYFLNAYKYNYQNPLRAKICNQAEEYPFSTLYSLVKNISSPVPLEQDSTFLFDPVGTLKWINTLPDPKKLEGVRFGLKRMYFQSKRDKNTREPVIRDDEVL